MVELDHDARRLMACLGDASRYRIVQALVGGEVCVTDLAHCVELSQSCTTRHLQALGRDGLVLRRRDGKRVLFRLNTTDARLRSLLDWAAGGRVPESDATLEKDRVRGTSARARAARTGAPRRGGPDGPPNGAEKEPARSDDQKPAARRRGDLEDYLL